MSERTILKACIAACCVMICGISVRAQGVDTSLTDLRLFGGAFAGLNAHSGSFLALPTVPNCCVTFTSGSGFGLTLNAGIETDLSLRVFGSPVQIGIGATYQLLSGTFTESEFVGNIISGATVTQGTVEHTLTASYGIIGVEPFATFQVAPSIPLRAHVGFVAGIPIGATYSQNQALTSPADPGYTFENGSRTRNASEGALPDASGLYAGIVVGARYEFALSPQLTVSPEVFYQIGLTNIVSSASWSVSALRGGATFSYRLSKPPPPPPPPPQPPPVVIAALRSEVRVEGQQLRGDTIEVSTVSEVVAVVSYEAAPIIFFEKNSTMPVKATSQLGMYQQNVIGAIRSFAEQHPDANFVVVGSCAADEEESIARERLSWAIRELNVDMSRLTIKYERQGEVPYPELADEQRSVTFLVNGKAVVIPVVQSDTTRSANDIVVPVAHLITCEAGPCTTDLRVAFSGVDLKVQGAGPVYSVVLPQRLLLATGSSEMLVVQGSVKDTSGRVASSSETVIVVSKLRSRSELRTTVGPEYVDGDPLVLGHFAFDASTFTTTNPTAVRIVKEAIASGKRVTLIPSADNFGTEAYNEQLLQRRARAATDLLGVREQDVFVSGVKSSPASNETPMGRTANRSVRVIIK